MSADNVIALAERAGPRERILDTAIEMAARYGLHGLSLQMLADQVGLHKSTLFHHFASKGDLSAQALERVLEPILERMASLEGATHPHLDQLVRVSEQLVDHFADQRGHALFMLRCIVGPDGFESVAPSADDANHPVTRVFMQLGTWLYRAREAGAIRQVRVRHAIMNLLGLVMMFPATADGFGRDLFPGDPASPEARNARKAELIAAIRGMLAPI